MKIKIASYSTTVLFTEGTLKYMGGVNNIYVNKIKINY